MKIGDAIRTADSLPFLGGDPIIIEYESNTEIDALFE